MIHQRAILILLLFAASVLFAIVVALMASRRTVHTIPIPGHPGKAVEFIQCRALDGQYGYIVRLPHGAETKHPYVSSDVPIDELRAGTRVEYDDETLTVFGPHGQKLIIGGFVP